MPVGGKLFAVIGAVDDAVSVKRRDVEAAQLLIELGRAERAPYFHRSWVRIPLGEGCPVEKDELAERLLSSYRLVRAMLSKKVRRDLAPVP